MSVQSEIERIETAVSNSYTAVANKGGTVPSSPTVANLPAAINSITGMYQHNKDVLNSYINATDLSSASFSKLASQTPTNINSSISNNGYYWSGITTTRISNIFNAGYTKVYRYDSGVWNEIDSSAVLSGPFCVPVGTTMYIADEPYLTLYAIYSNSPRQ